MTSESSKRRRASGLVVAALLVSGLVCPVWAQTPSEPSAFTLAKTGAQLRDAAIDPANGCVYVAAYNRNEVWRVDLANAAAMQPLATAQVEAGPAALALSRDGGVLACLNRLAETLTLLRTPGLEHIGTASCGKGACDVTALPGGGFAVANSFADSVTIVDPARPESPSVIEHVASVPNSVAASASCLAVGTRVPAALLLYGAGSPTPAASIPLPSAPRSIDGIDGDRFVVGAKEGLFLVDAGQRTIAKAKEIAVLDVTATESGLLALAQDGLHVFDMGLNEVEHIPLAPGGRFLTSSHDVTVVLSPTERTWQVRGVLPAVVAAAEPAAPEPEPVAPEPEPIAPWVETVEFPAEPEQAETEEAMPATPEPVAETETPEQPVEPAAPVPPVVEAAEVESPEVPSEPAPESQEEPVEVPSEPAPATEQTPEPEEEAEQAVQEPPKPAEPTVVEAAPEESSAEAEPPCEPEPTPEVAEETDETREPETETAKETPVPEEERRHTWQTLQRTPLGGMETSAPRFSRRAPGPPGADMRPLSLSEALAVGMNLTGQGGAFEPPDWTRPMQGVVADHIDASLDEEEYHFSGNVQSTLDTLTLNADELYYRKGTEEEAERAEATGNVVIRQRDSVFTADHVEYIVPPRAQLAIPEADPYPLAPGEGVLTEQERARRALRLGQLEAENVHLAEPYREMDADVVVYDFATNSGHAENARGMVLVNVNGDLVGLRFGAQKLRLTGEGSGEAEDLYITTSAYDPPRYALHLDRATLEAGEAVTGYKARLQIGRFKTPLYWPKWAHQSATGRTIGFDFDSGRSADIGYYLNFGQQFLVSPDLELGYRLYPTEKAGVGFGFEGDYDFMKTPTSPLFRGKGTFRTMATTKDSGYIELYHRQELFDDTAMLVQAEQWFKEDFVKDFYYDRYRHRTEPRSFVNVTHRKPNYIATGTVRKNTHDFVAETESAPEVTFHLLERPVAGPLYFTFDTIEGYYEREPAGTHAARSVNVGRLTLDMDLHEALSLTPFVELEGAWYSDEYRSDDSEFRFSTTAGATLQTRFHRAFPGAIGFSGFKHVLVPSMTWSYRPEPSMGVEETPRFDAYDNVYGRSRIETKIDNILYGRDAETEEVWQVARLTLYQGNDFWNELRRAEDYELELDLRPRPWWGFQIAGERHHISNDVDIDAPFFFERRLLEVAERLFDRPIDPEVLYRYNAYYADYDRILSYIYYDDRVFQGKFNARIGFAYTKTRDEVFNREILYGMGYKLGPKWSVAFEHRYDFERDDLYRQVYELRRNLDGLEAAVQFRDRTEGWDVGFELSLVAFPGTKVKF